MLILFPFNTLFIRLKKQCPDATGNTSNDVQTDKSCKDAEVTKKKSISSEGKKDDPIAVDSVDEQR